MTDQSPKCFSCESGTVELSQEIYKFQYGVGQDPVVLEVVIPVHVCSECGYSFFDYGSEVLIHSTVCKHLGVLDPQEIVSLREKLGYTQKNLADALGVEEMMVWRWEEALMIQQKHHDVAMRKLLTGEPN